MQWPLTAAMVGLNTSRPDSKELTVGISQKVPGNSPTEPPRSFRSAPAQKAVSPAPVTIPTQASSSATNRCQAALRSRRRSLLTALSASGRL